MTRPCSLSLFLSVLLLSLTACSLGTKTSSDIQVTMCSQVAPTTLEPIGVTGVFVPETPVINAVVTLGSVDPNTPVEGRWVLLGSAERPSAAVVASQQTVASSSRLRFALARPGEAFPTGSYALEVSVGGEYVGRAPFTVGSGAAVATIPAGVATTATARSDAPARGRPVAGASKNAAPSAAPGQTRQARTTPSIQGTWLYETGAGPLVLAIGPSTLDLGGESYRYTLTRSSIRVREDGETVDYPYSVAGNTLTVGMPGAGSLQFHRAGTAAASAAATQGGWGTAHARWGGAAEEGWAGGGAGGWEGAGGGWGGEAAGGGWGGEAAGGGWGGEAYTEAYVGANTDSVWAPSEESIEDPDSGDYYEQDSEGYGGGAYENPDSGYYEGYDSGYTESYDD